jgi:hypothetical protein
MIGTGGYARKNLVGTWCPLTMLRCTLTMPIRLSPHSARLETGYNAKKTTKGACPLLTFHGSTCILILHIHIRT